jgi:hypothetical protein
MILSEAERSRRIEKFLARKFEQFDMKDKEPTLRSIHSLDKREALDE